MAEASNISVVIPAYGPTPHLAGILEALLSGTLAPREIIVSHSGSDDPSAWLAEHFPDVTALHSPHRLFAGAARNRGAAHATSEVLAFCDSDVLPRADWLERLSAALDRNQHRFVVGAVEMARTGGYWGTANWLCEFSEMGPWRKGGVQTGGASCNMAVRRSDFERVGGFDESMTPGEDTILFHSLREAGLQQWFEPSALVGHYNHAGFAAFAHHQRRLGEQFAKVRSMHPLKGDAVVRHPSLAALIWAPKLGLVAGRMMEGGTREWGRLVTYGPALLAGSLILAGGTYKGSRAARQELSKSACSAGTAT